MITSILEKVLNELVKENPDLSYIRGMVEVLLVTQHKEVPNIIGGAIIPPNFTPAFIEKPQDEGSLLEARARAAIETIKALNQEAPNPELPR